MRPNRREERHKSIYTVSDTIYIYLYKQYKRDKEANQQLPRLLGT